MTLKNLKPSLHKLDWKLSPTDVFSRLIEQTDYAYILESVEGPERLAEYSFVGFNPHLHISVKDGSIEVHDAADCCKTKYHAGDPIPIVRSLLGGFGKSTANAARFIGGAVGYISYDAVRYWEHLPNKAVDEFGFPDIELAVYNDGILFDHRRGKVYYYHYGDSRMHEVKHLIREGPRFEPLNYSNIKTSVKKEKFEELVVKCKEYVGSGDIFQAVLSKRFEFTFNGSLIPFYMALRRINPSPYMYFLKMKNRQIVGSSPEMLVRVEGENVETFPIAGTRPRRPEDPAEDEALARDLLGDPKERAEHVMLVDLARNDVGRVCEYGSVHVPEFMRIYKYSHVQHMVSRVVGKLRKGFDCYDALKAVFPAGTVTGAPKVRAMEIIEELEPCRRGPYAGAVGYFSHNGNADFAITIRTLIAYGNCAYIQAGAGIVADSNPEKEWLETEHKAQALLKALQIASEEKRLP